MKHTKGEWRNSLHVRKANEHTIYSEHGITICVISDDVTINDSEENQANAKLIAAAPELLEFAIEMVRRYPNSPWIYKQGNAAIKKATE